MAKDTVAEVYARALLEAAVARGEAENLRSEAEEVRQVFSDEAGLLEVLRHPAIATEEKLALVNRAFGNASELLRNLLGVLIEKRRIDKIVGVLEAFGKLLDDREGILRGTVTSAVQLETSDRESIAAALSKNFGGNVVLNEKIDESLVGGFTARVGDTVFDGSVLSHLKKMSDRLADLTVADAVWE